MTTRGKGILMAIPILLVLGLLWAAYFYYTLSPIAEVFVTGEPVLIQKGDGLKEIADKFEALGYIRSSSAFKFYSLLSGSGHQLKPGLYNISAASSTTEIVRLLVSGPPKEIKVLITEGESLSAIDARLAHLGIIKAGDFLNIKIGDLRAKYSFLVGARSLEGYLFPDTYRFYFDSSPQDAVKPFLDNFAGKVGPLISEDEDVYYDSIPVVRRGIYSINEIVTVASLIEKEVPDSDERRLVSDIIYRRLKIGMALQIDASVAYAKLVGDPRYDTYQFPGFPAGPIASPGLDALTAALNPKSNQYLYYLSDPRTKQTIFSKTFEEHKANTEKYLK